MKASVSITKFWEKVEVSNRSKMLLSKTSKFDIIVINGACKTFRYTYLIPMHRGKYQIFNIGKHLKKLLHLALRWAHFEDFLFYNHTSVIRWNNNNFMVGRLCHWAPIKFIIIIQRLIMPREKFIAIIISRYQITAFQIQRGNIIIGPLPFNSQSLFQSSNSQWRILSHTAA